MIRKPEMTKNVRTPRSAKKCDGPIGALCVPPTCAANTTRIEIARSPSRVAMRPGLCFGTERTLSQHQIERSRRSFADHRPAERTADDRDDRAADREHGDAGRDVFIVRAALLDRDHEEESGDAERTAEERCTEHAHRADAPIASAAEQAADRDARDASSSRAFRAWRRRPSRTTPSRRTCRPSTHRTRSAPSRGSTAMPEVRRFAERPSPRRTHRRSRRPRGGRQARAMNLPTPVISPEPHINLPTSLPPIIATIVTTSSTAPIAGSTIVEPRLARAAKKPPTNDPAAHITNWSG